ncbi:fumarylacetoacetate hydrolase family protein [Paraburkholderia sp. ZP32-5]|uniref:fumarylacetoacetate hydrolase family protein n=1 Tax=Paraburkholderia sp. ZP32-5 TaxID=2883245 RepID=UPI001F2CFA55|nr:fumarylacetoacetate hydrolase family protein [Paraburkholderia sp. ZP32-5]
MTQIWCRFSDGKKESFGLREGDFIVEVEGSPFGEYRVGTKKTFWRDVELLVPVIPGTFYAIGSNYRNHVLARAEFKSGTPKFYDEPRVGYRANSALVASGHNIVKPRDAGPDFQYEGELVAVIGKRAKNVTPAEAEQCIFGWTIGNDITERSWQKNDPTNLRGKNADTFKPMGPWITTGLSLADMTTTVRLNGEQIHEFATGNMLFSPGEVISAISRYNTLHPGDVVWLGTDELPRNLVDGDEIEIAISGLGVLRNKVVVG